MAQRLLLSGHKSTFEIFSFNAKTTTLAKVSDSPAPTSATWLERSPTLPGILYCSSEDQHKVYCLAVGGEGVRVVDERETGCTWPVHFAIKKDGSALVTGGLGSGETIYIPLKPDGTFASSQSPLLTYPEPYPYRRPNNNNASLLSSNDVDVDIIDSDIDGDNAETKQKREAKFLHRQTGPHVHGLTFDSGGRVYINDLGSDTTWIAELVGGEDGELRVVGRMESHRGDTPRHCLLSPDEKYLYVNSELQSELLIYSVESRALLSRTDVTPPHLSAGEKAQLLTAEMYLHPHHPRTLYISNRGTLRLSSSTPTTTTISDNKSAPGPGEERKPNGDSITIILLSKDGSSVESLHYVETGLDWPRGMRISDDGQYLAIAGEYRGGVEVYRIKGVRGEVLELLARDEGVRDVNCVMWL